MNALDIFFDPVALFKRLDSRPSWLVPFVIVALVGIATAVLMAPIAEQSMLRQMPEGLSAEMQSQVTSAVRSSRYYGILGTPVALLLKWSVLGFLIFSVSVLCGGDTSFRKSLSVLAHISIVSAVDSLVGVAVIYLAGIEAFGSPSGIRPATLSLAFFLGDDAHPALRVALENLTVFSVWGYALLALGIALTTRLTKRQSVLVAGAVWGMQTVFLVGLALIVSRFGLASV